MADDTYLFIDGEYLRQIHREAMRDFFGKDGELDIHEAKHQAGAIRAFFYDSIDETPRPRETEEACHTRLVPVQNFFTRTGALSGFTSGSEPSPASDAARRKLTFCWRPTC
jgi:hypothetical protein